MKGLLIKDFRLMKNTMKNSMIMIVLIAVGISVYVNNISFVITYLTIIGSSFTISTLSYDEFDNGYAFLFSLPFTRRGYITEKYLFGICISGICWLLGTIVSIIACIVKSEPLTDTILTSLTLLPTAFLVLSLFLPFYLKFGPDKYRIVMIGSMGLLFLLVALGAKMFESSDIDFSAVVEKLPTLGPIATIAAFYAIGIAVLLLSCAISVRIMEKKEF